MTDDITVLIQATLYNIESALVVGKEIENTSHPDKKITLKLQMVKLMKLLEDSQAYLVDVKNLISEYEKRIEKTVKKARRPVVIKS